MQRRSLNCWKEIAAYLGCGVRTAQRWERNLGLPVRRPNIAEYRIVVAFEDELDSWREMWNKADVSNAETFPISLPTLDEDILNLQAIVRDRAHHGNVRSIVITFSEGSAEDQPNGNGNGKNGELKTHLVNNLTPADRKATNYAKQAESLLSSRVIVRKEELLHSSIQRKVS